MATQTLTLPVTGMHCASCALLIQKTVKKMAGVETSEVNYGTEQLRLSFDPERLELPALDAKVRELIVAAEKRALENGRKTVRPCDL